MNEWHEWCWAELEYKWKMAWNLYFSDSSATTTTTTKLNPRNKIQATLCYVTASLLGYKDRDKLFGPTTKPNELVWKTESVFIDKMYINLCYEILAVIYLRVCQLCCSCTHAHARAHAHTIGVYKHLWHTHSHNSHAVFMTVHGATHQLSTIFSILKIKLSNNIISLLTVWRCDGHPLANMALLVCSLNTCTSTIRNAMCINQCQMIIKQKVSSDIEEMLGFINKYSNKPPPQKKTFFEWYLG